MMARRRDARGLPLRHTALPRHDYVDAVKAARGPVWERAWVENPAEAAGRRRENDIAKPLGDGGSWLLPAPAEN